MPDNGNRGVGLMARDYAKEYREYHQKPEQKKRRAARNAARRKMIKSGLAEKGDGRDVHHRNRNPQDNRSRNLAVTSTKKNRGWRKGQRKS